MTDADKRRINDALWILDQYKYELIEIIENSNYQYRSFFDIVEELMEEIY